MSKINIAYLAKAKFGGWPTFTKHLHAALKAAGLSPVIRTVGARKSPMPHDFGHGLMARRVTIEDLLASPEPLIIAAADKDHAEAASRLVGKGCLIVVHDPAEKHLAQIPPELTVVIRRSMKARLPKAHFIPHPYARVFDSSPHPVSPDATPVAHSRIDFDKYTHLILEANDLGAGIRIMGAPNPMYVHFKIHPRWPDFSAEAFPRDMDAGAQVCRKASAVVDMSAIKNDGGGSQYSFLEAWDAQVPLIVNRKWTDGFPDDEMQPGINCLAAKDGPEIKACLDLLAGDSKTRSKIVASALASLDEHSPAKVGSAYRSILGA